MRLDEQLKKRAELRLEAMGMTATEAVEQLYRFIADHGRMPVTERIVTFDIQSQRGRATPLNPRRRCDRKNTPGGFSAVAGELWKWSAAIPLHLNRRYWSTSACMWPTRLPVYWPVY